MAVSIAKASGTDKKFRDRIVDYLRRHGGQSIDSLGAGVGGSPITMPQHLGVLRRQGKVAMVACVRLGEIDGETYPITVEERWYAVDGRRRRR